MSFKGENGIGIKRCVLRREPKKRSQRENYVMSVGIYYVVVEHHSVVLVNHYDVKNQTYIINFIGYGESVVFIAYIFNMRIALSVCTVVGTLCG